VVIQNPRNTYPVRPCPKSGQTPLSHPWRGTGGLTPDTQGCPGDWDRVPGTAGGRA